MPEWSSDASASTVTTTLTMPRRLTVAAGWPTAALPVSQTRIVSARSRSAWLGDERLEPAGALLLGSLDDQLQVDRDVVAERAQGGEVHDDVALAVGGAAAVPAAVDLGQLERRGAPGGVVERRLHVVVGVEQHGRGVRVGPGPRPDHRVGCRPAVSLEVGVGEAELGELVEHPLGGPGALLGGELPRVGHRPDGDELGELLPRRTHQVGDAGAQVHGSRARPCRSVLRSSTNSWKSSSSSGQ